MKILLFFHGGSQNRGAEAIIRTGVSLIHEKYPNAIIDLASENPESDKSIPGINHIFRHKITPIKKYTFSWFISAFKVKLFKDESYAYQKMHASIIKKIANYNLFLSTGGDNYCYGEQPGIYEIDRQIKKANKKLVLWGASICKDDMSPLKIKDLKGFDLILARETYTFKTLKELGLTNMKLCADGAFLLEKEALPLPKHWQEGNTIGINYSPLVYKKNQASKKAVKHLIDHILKTTNMTIALTPHVIDKGNNDYEILNDFYTEFKDSKRVLLLPDNLNALQYKAYIARMRFFIGARTHATIAAYSSLVPTLVLGYSVKSKGIAYDLFGKEKLVLSIDELSDKDLLINKFKQLVKEEKIINKELTARIPYIKSMALKSGQYLNDLF